MPKLVYELVLDEDGHRTGREMEVDVEGIPISNVVLKIPEIV